MQYSEFKPLSEDIEQFKICSYLLIYQRMNKTFSVSKSLVQSKVAIDNKDDMTVAVIDHQHYSEFLLTERRRNALLVKRI